MDSEHTLSRRRFLGAGAGAAAAAALGAGAATVLDPAAARALGAAGAHGDAFTGPAILPAERIGIQLYSVRDQVQSVGFARVFEVLAQIGYKQVEFAGYTQGTGAITLAQIRQLMDLNGLSGIGSHVSPSSDASMQQILDQAQILGLPQVGISFIVPTNTTVAGWTALADSYNHYGSLSAARGIGFYLHNHFQEWAPTSDDPTRRGIDVLLAETDPALVSFELDIYWAYVGQSQFSQPFAFDPLLDYAVPLRNRFKLFHVKDGKRDASGGFTDPFGSIIDVGQGHIDFETFFCTLFEQATGEQQRHWYIQERDNAADHPHGSLIASLCSYLWMRRGLVGC